MKRFIILASTLFVGCSSVPISEPPVRSSVGQLNPDALVIVIPAVVTNPLPVCGEAAQYADLSKPRLERGYLKGTGDLCKRL